jgi:hypothetical protein
MKLITIIMILTMISAIPMTMAATTKIYPSDDVFVRDDDPNDNFGTGSWQNDLRIGYQSSHGNDETYLKFDISGLSGEIINSASLSFDPVAYNDNPVVNLYYVSSNGWNENSITWNSKPSQSTFLDSASITGPDRVGFDIGSSYISGNYLSVALVENGGQGFVQGYSTNLVGGENYWPYLEVDYGTGGECNTAADINCDGFVSLTEYTDFKYGFKNGYFPEVTLVEYNDIKYAYKNGLLN